ncbi:uncharacterized protein [Vicugna pacos]|uniref:Uncharacterized protein n=1 Tax=Vicugna pacos TaxID=30538 RepID=A0ABM5CGI0_VICPA
MAEQKRPSLQRWPVNLITADYVSPVHEACPGGHPSCANILLKHGAQVNGVTADWHTPLFNACVSGSQDCVNLLLQHGASPHPVSGLASPIHKAAKRGHVECIESLVAHGGDTDHNISYLACENLQVACAKKLLESGASVNQGRGLESPLHAVATASSGKLACLLMDFGADTQAKNAEGIGGTERLRNLPRPQSSEFSWCGVAQNQSRQVGYGSQGPKQVNTVTLKQKTEQIKNLENEKRELAENISAWVQKTNNAKKCLEETIRQKMLAKKSLMFKENLKTIERVNEGLNDIIQIAQAKLQAVRDAKSLHLPGVSNTRSEDSMQQAVTTEDCSLEEGKKKMQDHHAASGSLKEREEDGFQEQVKKVRVPDEISRQRTMDTKGKVDMNGCELVGKQRLLASEEKAKLAEEETREYKIKLEECHVQMREAEITWRHQVALAEKKAQDSSLRAQELERDNSDLRRDNSDLRRDNSDLRRDNSDQRREVAHLKQRLDAICKWRQAEEYMRQEPTPGGPYRLHPPLRASGLGGTSVRNGNAFPAHEGEEAQATPWAGGPQPFPGPVCVACPAYGPSSPTWAPAPVPPWCPVPPRPPPPAAPLGGMSVSHFAEEEGGESSSEEEGATEPEHNKPEDATGTVETAPWELRDHTTPTSSAGAHGAYYTPGHSEFQTSRCLSRTTWCTLPPGTPITNSQMLFITATPTSVVASVGSVTGTSYFARTVYMTPEEASQLWQ